MKKFILLIITALCLTQTISAQEIFQEVTAIMEKNKTAKFDTKKSLQERKLSTFKYDAIYYLIMKAAEADSFTERQLGEQVSAMIDYVNLFIGRLSQETKKSRREVVVALFKKYTLENALFHDMDKEVVYGYVDNENFLTQFSLDTNWVQALEEVQKVYK